MRSPNEPTGGFSPPGAPRGSSPTASADGAIAEPRAPRHPRLDSPGRLLAIFDWELATIGDPLADVGYLSVTWAEPDDPGDTMFSSLSAVTRREGFPKRDELIARYEERAKRSVSSLNWYQALALWKAAIFMEGNYKRFLAGASDDSFLELLNEGVPALARRAKEVGPARSTASRPRRSRG